MRHPLDKYSTDDLLAIRDAYRQGLIKMTIPGADDPSLAAWLAGADAAVLREIERVLASRMN